MIFTSINKLIKGPTRGKKSMKCQVNVFSGLPISNAISELSLHSTHRLVVFTVLIFFFAHLNTVNINYTVIIIRFVIFCITYTKKNPIWKLVINLINIKINNESKKNWSIKKSSLCDYVHASYLFWLLVIIFNFHCKSNFFLNNIIYFSLWFQKTS